MKVYPNMSEFEREMKQGVQGSWSLNRKEQFVAKKAIYRHCKIYLSFIEEFEFLESTDELGAGVVVGHFTPKGRERYSIVLGAVNSDSDPYIFFTSVPIHNRDFDIVV